jgi:hypothetical protein
MTAVGHRDVAASVCQHCDTVQSLMNDAKWCAELLGKFCRQMKLIFNEVKQRAPHLFTCGDCLHKCSVKSVRTTACLPSGLIRLFYNYETWAHEYNGEHLRKSEVLVVIIAVYLSFLGLCAVLLAWICADVSKDYSALVFRAKENKKEVVSGNQFVSLSYRWFLWIIDDFYKLSNKIL